MARPMTASKRPLTVSESARETGYCEATIRVYCNRGVLRSVRTTSGVRLIEPDDVARLRREHQQRDKRKSE